MNERMKKFLPRAAWTAFTMFVLACSERPIDSDCGQACEPFAKLPGVGECQQGHCMPTFFECFDKMEFDTCDAMCESIGSSCAERACGEGTYLIHGSLEKCLDLTSEGALFGHLCDEPIDWQVYTIAQCCCEQP